MPITLAPSSKYPGNEENKGIINTYGINKQGMRQIQDAQKLQDVIEAQFAKKVEKQQKVLDQKSQMFEALTTLGTKTTAFRNAASTLGVYAQQNVGISVFQERTCSITASGTSAPTVTADATVGATCGSYTVSVNRLAQPAQSVIFASLDPVNGPSGFDSSTVDVVTGAAGFFTAGTFDIKTSSGPVAITLVGGDTLQTICNKINEVTATTGVKANLDNGGYDGWMITLKSTTTGLQGNFNIVDTGALNRVETEDPTAPIRHMWLYSSISNTGRPTGWPSRATTIAAGLGILTVGTVTINGTVVTVVGGDCLDTIAQKINAVISTTGIQASILEDGAGNPYIALDLMGTVASTISLTADGVFGGVSKFTTAACDSSVTVDGVTATNPTNTITPFESDEITLTLQAINSIGTSQTVTVSPDINQITAAITGFATAYNDLSGFITAQTERDSDSDYSFKDTALLGKAGSSVIRLSDISTALNQVLYPVPGLTGNFTSLANLGFVFTDITPTPGSDYPQYRGLTYDPTVLAPALQNNLSAVQSLFAPGITSAYPNITYCSSNNTSKITLSTFEVQFDVAAGVVVGGSAHIIVGGHDIGVGSATYDAATNVVTVTGLAGTEAEGLTLQFSNIGPNAGASTFNPITFSPGLSNVMLNNTSGYDQSAWTNTISTAQSAISSRKDREKQELDRMIHRHEKRAEREQQALERLAMALRRASEAEQMLKHMLESMAG